MYRQPVFVFNETPDRIQRVFCFSTLASGTAVLTRLTVYSPHLPNKLWSYHELPHYVHVYMVVLQDCSVNSFWNISLLPTINLYRQYYLTSQANKKEMKVKLGSGLAGDGWVFPLQQHSVFWLLAPCLSAAWLVPTCLNWCICPINETDGQRFTWVIYARVESAARPS